MKFDMHVTFDGRRLPADNLAGVIGADGEGRRWGNQI